MAASSGSQRMGHYRKSCAAHRQGSTYRFKGDEHGAVVLPDGIAGLPLGTIIECLTPHCDPSVNLYDWYHVVRGDTLVDIWPVDARGAI